MEGDLVRCMDCWQFKKRRNNYGIYKMLCIKFNCLVIPDVQRYCEACIRKVDNGR